MDSRFPLFTTQESCQSAVWLRLTCSRNTLHILAEYLLHAYAHFRAYLQWHTKYYQQCSCKILCSYALARINYKSSEPLTGRLLTHTSLLGMTDDISFHPYRIMKTKTISIDSKLPFIFAVIIVWCDCEKQKAFMSHACRSSITNLKKDATELYLSLVRN